ncbi:MAG: RES family NAD+ phosphorylase [Burkholderiaceae bacterium]
MADPLPAPPPDLATQVTLVTYPIGATLYRVHPTRYAGDAFNPGSLGDARFSPIRDTAGNQIPTIYAADAFEGAAMETVFHDVPYGTGLKSFLKRNLVDYSRSVLITTSELTLVTLANTA